MRYSEHSVLGAAVGVCKCVYVGFCIVIRLVSVLLSWQLCNQYALSLLVVCLIFVHPVELEKNKEPTCVLWRGCCCLSRSSSVTPQSGCFLESPSSSWCACSQGLGNRSSRLTKAPCFLRGMFVLPSPGGYPDRWPACCLPLPSPCWGFRVHM